MSENISTNNAGGRPRSEVPETISMDVIRHTAELLDPSDDANAKVTVKLPEHLLEHIRRSSPSSVNANTIVTAALATFGYPVTSDELGEMQSGKAVEETTKHSNVIPMKRGRGRPKQSQPAKIALNRIQIIADILDPTETEPLKFTFRIPNFLRDHISATLPRKSSMTSLLLAGFRNLGFPITPEELIEMQTKQEAK